MRIAYTLLGAVVFNAALHAQAPKPAAAASTPVKPEVVLTATSANVKDAGTPVQIRILRWSTDEERTRLTTALTTPPAPAGRPGGGGRAGGAPGAGQGQGGAQAQGGAAQGGAQAQGGGRGGRGRGDAAPLTPVAAFTQALQNSPSLGFLWTDDVSGYSLKHAWRSTQADGTDTIVLVTDRRLGAFSPEWTVTGGGAPTEYEFTLIELRLGPKGGEGKSSLTTKIVGDPATKQLALENYAGAPAILTNVKMVK